MDYTRKTVELLMKRYPEYLVEKLRSQGITIDLQQETAASITAMIANRSDEEVKHHESSIYTCKCGSKCVVTREVQTRSLDEGSTIVHICNKCGNTY